jgi:hypothetical protein
VVNYIFEIDEDFRFGTPISSGVVAGTAVYCEWNVPFTLPDSGVYYWRVRLADVSQILWAEATFKYIAGKSGWGQSVGPQFLKDGTENMLMNPVQLEWQMENRIADIHVSFDPDNNAIYRMSNGAFGSELSEPPNGVLYTTFNRRLLEPGIQGTIHGDWAYMDPATAQTDLIASIATTPPGDFILIVSNKDPMVATWGSALMYSLHNLGCDTTQIRNILPGRSIIILARKGAPSEIIEIYAPNYYDQTSGTWAYDLLYNLQSPFPSGKVFSTTIGPSVKWTELIWDWSSVDPFVNENATVSAWAVRLDNTDSLIYSGLARGAYPLTALDADEFPFMRMQADVVDSVYLTAPQLDNWYVIYEAAPDAAIDPVDGFVFLTDTVVEGAVITVDIAARNLTDLAMDSLLVQCYVRRASDNSIIPLQGWPIRFDSLRGSESNRIRFSFDTYAHQFTGLNTLVMEINPDNDQPELYHFNNLYDYPFFVIQDVVNPLMDVTFNGKHIMDGDFVSPTPEIIIELNDENPFLAINDTAYEVYFAEGYNNLQRIFISGNPMMESVPASLPNNKAKLYFRPGQLANGEYTLKVQGYDHEVNSAGRVEYEITFNVENESAVTQMLNYPNPFSSQTRFAYLLTGAELPDMFQVHIYTITGKLVKVIDLADMNQIQYGYNVTDYAWDGRDEFGDLLANGVYIYRVAAKVNGEEMKIRDEGINQYFKNGFGKMYIMR